MKDADAPVVSRIEEIVRDVPGWSPVDQLYTLFNLVYLNPDLPGDIVEIGSWCGRSTAVLGLAARLVGGPEIVCIDLFPAKDDWRQNPDGSYSFEVAVGGVTHGAYREQTVWREPFERDIAPLYEKHDSVFDIFTETVKRNGLADLVRPFRGTSTTWRASAPAGFRCRLAVIDGDHSYEAVRRDIESVEPFLVDGGWIGFDDAFSSYEGVDRAITELVIDNPAYELGRRMTRKFFAARKRRKGAVRGAGAPGGAGTGRG